MKVLEGIKFTAYSQLLPFARNIVAVHHTMLTLYGDKADAIEYWDNEYT